MIALVAAFVVAADTVWYAGAISFVIALGACFGFGYSRARCPCSGQVWWSSRSGRYPAPWWCDIRVSPQMLTRQNRLSAVGAGWTLDSR